MPTKNTKSTKPLKTKGVLEKYAEGNLVGTYDTIGVPQEYDPNNLYTYGLAKSGERDFGFNKAPTPTTGTQTSTANTTSLIPNTKIDWSQDYYNLLSPESQYYLKKKAGFDIGEVTKNYGMDRGLEAINKIITFKGGSPISDFSQANQALAPLIEKRNKRGIGGLGAILGTVAPLALNFIPGVGPALSAVASAGMSLAKGDVLGAGLSLIPGGAGSFFKGATGPTNLLAGSRNIGMTPDLSRLYNEGGYISQHLAEGGMTTAHRQVQGAGDGMSDNVPAMVDNQRPAMLSDGEHVVPALQVAMLGRGSGKAGSERVKQIVDRELAKMYGSEVDPRQLQRKAMNKDKK